MSDPGPASAGRPIIAAVLVSCSKRKTISAPASGRAVSLPRLNQKELETAWLERVRSLPPVISAGALYDGRGVRFAKETASTLGAPLYVVSAGLGLVHESRLVPAYGITLSGGGAESVRPRVLGRFNAVAWWRGVSSGPYSSAFGDMFTQPGLVLVAISRPYAEMLAPALDGLPDADAARVRILGVKLDQLLPSRVARCVLRYDDRLDSLFPGTRTDFATRALVHFASEGLSELPDGDIEAHQDWVQRALESGYSPDRSERPRMNDAEIIAIIERYLPQTKGVGRLLRVLRDEEQVACEQARFSRLYRAAVERSAAK